MLQELGRFIDWVTIYLEFDFSLLVRMLIASKLAGKYYENRKMLEFNESLKTAMFI